MRLHILCYCCCIIIPLYSSKWFFLALLSSTKKRHTICTTSAIVLLLLLICSSTTITANRNSKEIPKIYRVQQHLENPDILHHKALLEEKTPSNPLSFLTSLQFNTKPSPNSPKENNDFNSFRNSMILPRKSTQHTEQERQSNSDFQKRSTENVLFVNKYSNTTLHCDLITLLHHNSEEISSHVIWLKNNKHIITSYSIPSSSILTSSISSICLLLIRDTTSDESRMPDENIENDNKKCKYIISGDNGLFLHINNINYKDIGHYQCAQINERSGKIIVKGKKILLKMIDKPTNSIKLSSSSLLQLTTQHRHTRNIVESSLSAKITSSEWSSSSVSSTSNNDNRQQQQHASYHLSSQTHEETSEKSNNNGSNRGDTRRNDKVGNQSNTASGSSRLNDDEEDDILGEGDDIVEEPRALPQQQQLENPHVHQQGGSSAAGVSEEHDKNTNNPHKTVVKNEITYINQHEKLTLKCEVNINFTNNIWLKDGEVVDSIILTSSTVVHTSSGHGHRYTRDRAGNLYINNVRLEDNGQWQCEAEDAFGYVMTAKPIHLTVLEQPRKPYLLIDNRRLDPGNLFVPVKESTELDIQCIVEGGNPKPRLTWDLSIAPTPSNALDGPDMSVQVLNLTVIDKDIIEVGIERPSVDHNNGVISEAKLRVLRSHHNATISCLVHHLTLDIPLQASLLLDVQYTPSFAISREPGFGIPVLEGMPVSLKCDVDANPGSAPMWEKDDGPPPVVQSLDGYLNFTAIRREHSGWYKCTARYLSAQFSSIGYFLNVRYEASLDVTQEPEFDVSELSSTGKQLEVALGGAVHLQCPAGSHGCWSRVNAENGRLNPLGASQDLRLDKILYHEAGEYRCVAPGKDYKEKMDSLRNALIVNLSVKGRPTVHPSLQNLTSPPGETQSIIVEFCANPVYKSVLWISENKIFRPGFGDPLNNRIFAHDIINSTTLNCYQAKLTFMSIDYKDDGEYIFLVRSSSGLAEGIVYVSVLTDSDSTFGNSGGSNLIFKSTTSSIFLLFSSYIKIIVYIIIINITFMNYLLISL